MDPILSVICNITIQNIYFIWLIWHFEGVANYYTQFYNIIRANEIVYNHPYILDGRVQYQTIPNLEKAIFCFAC